MLTIRQPGNILESESFRLRLFFKTYRRCSQMVNVREVLRCTVDPVAYGLVGFQLLTGSASSHVIYVLWLLMVHVGARPKCPLSQTHPFQAFSSRNVCRQVWKRSPT